MMKRFTPKHALDKALQILAERLEKATSTQDILRLSDQIDRLASKSSLAKLAHVSEIYGKRSRQFRKALQHNNPNESLTLEPEDTQDSNL